MKTKYLIPGTMFTVLMYLFLTNWKAALWTLISWFVLCVIFLTLVEVVKYRRKKVEAKDGWYFEKKY